jgi:uncharacterized DUF497 family protein
MELEWDAAKREATLAKHEFDFVDAAELLAGPRFEWRDTRRDYGEPPWVTVGLIRGRVCVCVYTRRGRHLRIISLRRANSRQQARFTQALADRLGGGGRPDRP